MTPLLAGICAPGRREEYAAHAAFPIPRVRTKGAGTDHHPKRACHDATLVIVECEASSV